MAALDAVSRKKLQAEIQADGQGEGAARARRRSASANGARVSSPPHPSPGAKRTFSGNPKHTVISRSQKRRSSLSSRRQRARQDHSPPSFFVRVFAGTVRLGLSVVEGVSQSVAKTVANIRYEIAVGNDFFEDDA